VLDKTSSAPEPDTGSQDSGAAAPSPGYSSFLAQWRKTTLRNFATARQSLVDGAKGFAGNAILIEEPRCILVVQAWIRLRSI
jgi:hypothetical protein